MEKFDYRLYKKLIAFLIMISFSISVFAYDFEENGIYYDKVSSDCVEVVVGANYLRGGAIEYIYLTGDVVIPARTSGGYKVIGIAANTLCSVSSISLPETLMYIESRAFSGGVLKELYIPKSVTSIDEGAFIGCSNLERIEVDSENTVYDSRENSNAIIRTSDNTLILGCVNTTIPNSVMSIGQEAFARNSRIKKMVIPNTVMNIGSGAFDSCLDLEQIVLSQNLTSLSDNIFYGCKKLKEIDIPNNVAEIKYYAFYGCDSLSSVKFPSNLREIGQDAFVDCGNLKELNFSSNITINKRAFGYCKELEKVVFKNNITGGETKIVDYAFQNCTKLKELILPKNLTKIAGSAFAGCIGLEKMIVEEGNSIYESAEDNNSIICRTMENDIPVVDLVLANKDAIIPSNVVRLAPYAFLDGRNSVVIPENVLSIQKYSFVNCRNLKDVYMKSSTPPNMTQPASDDGAFLGTTLKVMTLHVPIGTKEIYSNPVLDWCLFGTIVEWDASGIEDVEVDESGDAPAVYYNLQGVRVENPEKGIFIKKQAGKTTKVVM